jgi:predicted O-linked N-acetylglucosamine transferase (SPINDLY family)
LLLAVGEPQLAKSQFQQAIAIAPQDFVGYLNLGNLFEQQQQLETAIECYQKALKLAPQSPDVLRALGLAFALHGDEIQAALYQGHALYHQQNYTEAIAQYEKVLQAPTKDVNFYRYLGASYARIDRQEKAIEIYQAGIREYPQDAHLYFGLLFSLQYFGRVREAIAVAELGVKSIPDNFALKLQKATLLPIIYQNQDDIDFYRQRFSQELKALISGRSLTDPKLVDDAVAAIGFHTNFYLAYQGRNDLPLQILWGRFVHQLMLAKYPKCDRSLTMPPVNRGEKIRIGYVSAYLSSHSVGKLALGWLKNRDRQNFEIHCYYTSVREDSITQQFKLYSDVFHHIPESLESLCQQIITDKLHILVYLDLGMEPKTNQVAALRLAPVQCTAWGHPITSGLPTIDYFLSSDLMEPENAGEHYSEKLIRLANLGFSYGKPLLPEISKRRSEFQLEDEAIVYLSCQSLYKYLPQHDYIFAEIARRTPGAKFVFIASDISPAITNIFRQRLQRAFANLNLASEEYCSVLPRLDSHYEYMNLLLVADIFLDTFAWSGGNTTLEALACNLPVVTCPGEFMRGRHSYGILQMMGMTETIARNEDEYIEIAVRLGLDTNWRKQIKEQISNNNHRLYDDKTCTIALEEFYRSVVYSGESAATTKLN